MVPPKGFARPRGTCSFGGNGIVEANTAGWPKRYATKHVRPYLSVLEKLDWLEVIIPSAICALLLCALPALLLWKFVVTGRVVPALTVGAGLAAVVYFVGHEWRSRRMGLVSGLLMLLCWRFRVPSTPH